MSRAGPPRVDPRGPRALGGRVEAPIALALFVALLTTGCFGLLDQFQRRGTDRFLVTNETGDFIFVQLRLRTADGGFTLFDDGLDIDRGGQKEKLIELDPGRYELKVDASNGFHDLLELEVPEQVDITFEIVVTRSGISIKTSF